MADVLQSLLLNGKSQLGDGFLRWRLEQDWLRIVGQTMAVQTVPCAIDHGVLWVWVSHPAWIQQLWFFKDIIREKVNAYLGRQLISDVRFTLNRRASINDIPSQAVAVAAGTGQDSEK